MRQRRFIDILAKFLASAWMIDGLLALQPANLGSRLGTTIGENAMGEPEWVRSIVLGVSRLATQHGVVMGLGVASVQLILAWGIWQARTRRAALWISLGWSLCVWGAGEAFGALPSGFGIMPAGAPGPALLYAVLAVVLLAGGRGGRTIWTILMVGAATAEVVPTVGNLGFKLAANLQMTSLGEPGLLAALDHKIGSYALGHGFALSVCLAAVELSMLLAPYAHGRATRPAIAMTWASCALLWCLGENFGGIATGSAGDIGAMPLYALLAWAAAREPALSGRSPKKAPVLSLQWTSLPALRPSGAVSHAAHSSILPTKTIPSRGAGVALASPGPDATAHSRHRAGVPRALPP